MQQIFLNMKTDSNLRKYAFVGEVKDHSLILSLMMPQDFLWEGAEYYLVMERQDTCETVFLPLLAKCADTLLFSVPAKHLSPPTAKCFVGAYGKKEEEYFLIKESKEICLFLENDTSIRRKGEKK